ncbi:MAG: hypothetical protein JO316_12790 [Abitibacteriaceae bacterium]|nr:hypothetical protein [Abditibacteriaceae bacterium]
MKGKKPICWLCCWVILMCRAAFCTASDSVIPAKGSIESQPNSPTPQDSTTQATDKLRHEYLQLFQHGDYEAIIDRLTPLLHKSSPPDSGLAYVHGLTSRIIGDLDTAATDLAPLGNYAPDSDASTWFSWPPASAIWQQVQFRRQLFPAHLKVLHDGETLRFNVYYDDMTDWTRDALSVLPRAYAANHDFLGQDFSTITVLLFNDYGHFTDYVRATRWDVVPPKYAHGIGSLEALCISRYNGYHQDWPALSSKYSCATVAHEMNHSLVERMIAGYGLPRWFMEGLAVDLQTRITPEDVPTFGRLIRQLVRQGGILSLDDLTYHFGDSVQVYAGESTQELERWRNSNAYQQGYSMVNYFLRKLKPGDLPHFLTDLREQRYTDKSARSRQIFDQQTHKYLGLSLDEFYTDWQSFVQRIYK